MIKILHAIASNPWVYDRIQSIAGSKQIAKHVNQFVSEVNGQSLLEIGVGTGEYLNQLPSLAKYVGLDIDLKKLKGFRNKSSDKVIVQGDATKICFKDKSFDYALCVFLSHHLSDNQFAHMISEASRVARKKLIFLDAIRDTNLIGKILWKLDRGDFPHSSNEIIEKISGHFVIEEVFKFSILHHYLLCVATVPDS